MLGIEEETRPLPVGPDDMNEPLPDSQATSFATPRSQPGAQLSAEARARLNRLRLVTLSCRSSARTDLFEACAMLSIDPWVAQTAHAEALVKCLPQVIGRQLKFFRPGTEEVSFDEAWLIALTEAVVRDDDDSFLFLLRSRVPQHARRSVGFLIRAMAD